MERQRETGTESDAHTGRNKDRRRCPIVDVCDPFDLFTVEFSESLTTLVGKEQNLSKGSACHTGVTRERHREERMLSRVWCCRDSNLTAHPCSHL